MDRADFIKKLSIVQCDIHNIALLVSSMVEHNDDYWGEHLNREQAKENTEQLKKAIKTDLSSLLPKINECVDYVHNNPNDPDKDYILSLVKDINNDLRDIGNSRLVIDFIQLAPTFANIRLIKGGKFLRKPPKEENDASNRNKKGRPKDEWDLYISGRFAKDSKTIISRMKEHINCGGLGLALILIAVRELGYLKDFPSTRLLKRAFGFSLASKYYEKYLGMENREDIAMKNRKKINDLKIKLKI